MQGKEVGLRKGLRQEGRKEGGLLLGLCGREGSEASSDLKRIDLISKPLSKRTTF